MKLRPLIIIMLLAFSRLSAQQSENVYLGNIAIDEYADDASYGPFNIGFTFNYYGNNYTQFFINSNGQVLFGSGSFQSSEAAIPTAAVPNNFIAPFWDDLVVDSYGRILYTTIGAVSNRKCIIQFKNMGFYPYPTNLGTFAVILYETSNVIQVQYRLIVLSSSEKAHGGDATIGVENASGNAGVQYAYHNPSAVTTNKAISFTPSPGPSYTMNPNAVYDWVYLTKDITLPEPGITNLVSPPQDAIIGSDYNFQWDSASYAASYKLYISTDPDLIDATSYPVGSNLEQSITGLTLDETYYWGVFAQNATGTTWCEIKRFTTSATPPLTPVPQTIWAEQGHDINIKLNYTGGDGSPKTAVVTSLPAQGQLYQYNAGVRGTAISSVPSPVTDAAMNVIYAASGSSGNGVGNFNFLINDAGGDSPEGSVTINVSPPGVPNLLTVSKSTTTIEMEFDIPMANPAGKQGQFTVLVNSLPAACSSASLKSGDPYTIVLTLTTPISVAYPVSISYSQGDIAGTTGGYLFSFTGQPVTLISQTITFTQSLTKKYSDSPFVLSATSTAGAGMTYSSLNLAVATIVANVATFHALGTSEITARHPGNATYAPAKYIRILSVAKGDQTITFNTLPVKTYGDPDFTPVVSASSTLPVSLASSNPLVATIVGTDIHITGGGSAVITASQPGNGLWNPAADVQRTLTVNKADQTISFSTLADKTYGDADFNLTATSSSGLTVSFAANNPAVVTVAGTLVHITGGGSVTITASQAGNTNFNPAPAVPQTLTINKADLTVTADDITKEFLAAMPQLTLSFSGFLNGESSSVLDVLPVAQTTATQSSSVGDYPITVSGGSDNSYNFLFESGTFTITKISQTITFTEIPEKLLMKSSGLLAATSTSGLTVLFESMDNSVATVAGNQITGVAKGNVQIRAYNNGDENYEAGETMESVEVYTTHKDILYLFTPNGDGYNDYWELPEMASWGKCDVKVYNRWAKLVFANADYNNLWDGMSDGNPLPEGAYYFVIVTENEGTVKGTLNLVR